MPRKPSKFLTIFNAVFEMRSDGRLSVEIDGDDGEYLRAELTEDEVVQLRDLLAEQIHD